MAGAEEIAQANETKDLPRQTATRGNIECKGIFRTVANLPLSAAHYSELADRTQGNCSPSGEPVEILVPGFSPLASGIEALLQKLAVARQPETDKASYSVDSDASTTPGERGRGPHGQRPALRTTAPHGLTPAEVKRLAGACTFMGGKRRTIYFATVGDRIFDSISPGRARDIIADVERRIGKLQNELGIPADRVTVYETIGGLHAHLVFLGGRRLVERLRQSSALEPYLDIRLVHDVPGLSQAYLAKERTPQAQYGLGHRLKGGRRRGSHQLPGGGDRVRLSAALKRDAIDAGYVEAWQPTNAKRSEGRKLYRQRRIVPWKSATPAGQIPLFPELERSAVRLRDFGGGTLPAATALEFEFRRRQLGLSQRKLGEIVGLSQPTLANAVAGLYGLSHGAVTRIKQVLAAAAGDTPT